MKETQKHDPIIFSCDYKTPKSTDADDYHELIKNARNILFDTLPQTEKTSQAISFAIKAHEGKYRKVSGRPYILHPFDTAALLSSISEDEDLIVAGVLHDTVEDSPMINGMLLYTNKLLAKKFGERVAGLVEAVTAGKSEREISTEDSEKKYWAWRNRKQRAMNKVVDHSKEAVLLKTADSLSNVCDFRSDLREADFKTTREMFEPFGREQESILARYTHTTIDLSIAYRKKWNSGTNPLIIDLIKNQILLIDECMDQDYNEVYNDWISDLNNELSEIS